MANQFQQAEKFDRNPCTDDTAKHSSERSSERSSELTSELTSELSRQAYTDVRVNIAEGGNNCGDVLPTCGFEPLTAKEQRQAYVREVAAPLFEGSPPLFAYLDRSSYKGENREFDGRVSVHNMHDFLKTYQTMSEIGQSQWPYTEKNAQYVRDLLDFKYPELTGENFAGFSAQALCRRAGLTKMSVKHYDDYAVLATAWKQALSEDVSFRRDAQANSGDRTTTIVSGADRAPCDAPQPPCPPVAEDAAPDTKTLNAAKPEVPCALPSEAPCPPAHEAPLVVSVESPCEADLVQQHDRAMRLRLEQMSTFEKGGSYWRMASRFLHAGMRTCDVDDVTNQDINRLTRAFVKINRSTIDGRGLPNPMVHPGDRVPVSQHLEELVSRHDKLARAIERMLNAEQ